MNRERRSFIRKVVYLAVIVVLLGAIAALSAPGGRPGQARARGKLAALRDEYQLGQANLGEIDPASETMKLATLGLRGVASNILWGRAIDYHDRHDWTNLSATLEQITKLQPNFVAVWKFQGWNLSYNVSVEFDAVEDRYRWVIKGIEFLRRGLEYNSKEPRLMWDVGWFTSEKIGRADEKVTFRRLFKEDDDYHDGLPRALRHPSRDNWLTGKQAYLAAIELDKLPGVDPGMSSVMFYPKPAICQIYYATAMAEDGTFGESYREAWADAYREWQGVGSIDFVTSTGQTIHLDDRDLVDRRSRQALDELNAMTEGIRERLDKEKRDKLTDAERSLLEVPFDRRSDEQNREAEGIINKIRVSFKEVADNVPEPNTARAQELAVTVNESLARLSAIENYRTTINYPEWLVRCQVEMDEHAMQARQAIFGAHEAMGQDADIARAVKLYDEALVHWRALLDKHPSILNDQLTGSELIDMVAEYERLLGQLELKIPEDFILSDVAKERAKSMTPAGR